MTVRRFSIAFPLLAALLLSAGCGGGDGVPFSAEADDPLYQQGQLLKKTGKNSEALATFLKVIEKRGEQASPESHLEVGIIYFQHTKDPVEAIHYLRKYLGLEPNSQQAPFVRQQVELARRELLRSMPGSPRDDLPVRTGLGGQDIIDKLQRENEDLRVENDRLKGVNNNAAYVRTPRNAIDSTTVTQVPVISPDQFVPRTEVTTPSFVTPPGMPQTTAGQVAPTTTRGTATTTTRPPTPTTTRQPTASPVTTPVPPTRPGSGVAAAGKRHKVAAGETLWRIGQKYGVKPEAIIAVNRDVLPAGVNSKLSPGMELKIP